MGFGSFERRLRRGGGRGERGGVRVVVGEESEAKEAEDGGECYRE